MAIAPREDRHHHAAREHAQDHDVQRPRGDLAALRSSSSASSRRTARTCRSNRSSASRSPSRSAAGTSAASCSASARARAAPSLTNYTADVVPSLWLLTRSQQSRIFQNKSVPDILKQVLLRPPGRLPACRERSRRATTACSTASRTSTSRAADGGGGDLLLLRARGRAATRSSSRTRPPGSRRSRLRSPSTPRGATRTDAGVIYAWEKDQELRSGKVTLCGPRLRAPAQQPRGPGADPGERSRRHGDAPPPRRGQRQVRDLRLSRRLREALRRRRPGGGRRRSSPTGSADGRHPHAGGGAPEPQVDGGSNAERLIAGYTFTLQGHFDANGAVGCHERRSHRAREGAERACDLHEHVHVHPGRAPVPASAADSASRSIHGRADGGRRRAGGRADLHGPVRAREGPVPLGPRRGRTTRTPPAGSASRIRPLTRARRRRCFRRSGTRWSSPSRRAIPTSRSSSAASTTREVPPP